MKHTAIALCTLVLLVGCATDNSKPYADSTSDYNKGKLVINQPDIKTTPDRKVDGIRLAGSKTDIDPSYWNALLLKGDTVVFETFKLRYTDLQVYGAQAEAAALLSFRAWTKTHNLNTAFEKFWAQ